MTTPEQREHRRYFDEIHAKARHLNGVFGPGHERAFDHSFHRAKAAILRLSRTKPIPIEELHATRKFVDAIKHHRPGENAEYGREITVAIRLLERMHSKSVHKVLERIDHHATALHGSVNRLLEEKKFDPIDHAEVIPIYVSPTTDIAHRARQAIEFLQHPQAHKSEVVRYGKGQIAAKLLRYIDNRKRRG